MTKQKQITELARMKMALLLIDEAATGISMFAKTDREREAADAIYKLAHAASAPKCRKNHKDWVKPIDAAIRSEGKKK